MGELEKRDRSKDKSGRLEAKKAPTTRIVLLGSNNNKTIVDARPTTMVGKLLSKYCEQRHVSPEEYRLIYNGKMMNEEDEIGSYNLEDNSVIEVVAQQVGGGVPRHSSIMRMASHPGNSFGRFRG